MKRANKFIYVQQKAGRGEPSGIVGPFASHDAAIDFALAEYRAGRGGYVSSLTAPPPIQPARADVDAAWRKIHGAIDARPCDSEPAP